MANRTAQDRRSEGGKAERHNPGLRCFLNVRVAPQVRLAEPKSNQRVDARCDGDAQCRPFANVVLQGERRLPSLPPLGLALLLLDACQFLDPVGLRTFDGGFGAPCLCVAEL
jgi:hypothetical protein